MKKMNKIITRRQFMGSSVIGLAALAGCGGFGAGGHIGLPTTDDLEPFSEEPISLEESQEIHERILYPTQSGYVTKSYYDYIERRISSIEDPETLKISYSGYAALDLDGRENIPYLQFANLNWLADKTVVSAELDMVLKEAYQYNSLFTELALLSEPWNESELNRFNRPGLASVGMIPPNYYVHESISPYSRLQWDLKRMAQLEENGQIINRLFIEEMIINSNFYHGISFWPSAAGGIDAYGIERWRTFFSHRNPIEKQPRLVVRYKNYIGA